MTKLIEKAKKGNKKAKEEIYNSTCDELFCYCRQLCGNENDAQDLMQDTYLTIFEKLEQYRRDDNFKGWIHTIALHKFYNKIRNKQPQVSIDEFDETFADDDELYAPESYAEKKDIQKILTEIISENLSDTQRITVILYYYDEMSVGEIAKELDCPEGTIKTRLYHSRKIIKDELLKRGVVLGGSTLLISAALKAYSSSFTISAASAAAGSVIGQNLLHTAVKSAITLTKGKIIAGAAVVAVAGGSVGIYHMANSNKEENEIQKSPIHSVTTEINLPSAETVSTTVSQTQTTVTEITTEETATEEFTTEAAEQSTEVSQPGGELLDYHFDSNNMTVMIPENYTPSMYFKTLNEDGSYSLTKTQMLDTEITNSRNIFSSHEKNVLKFKPDDFSGDETIFMARHLEEPEDIDIKSELDFFYDGVVLSEPQEIKVSMDNTNSPESPTEKSADSYSFTAEDNKLSGTALIIKGNTTITHIIIFSDCSGTRQQEYQAIIDSIKLSFQDNSWRDRYDIPDSLS